jgi:hypothetical protein
MMAFNDAFWILAWLAAIMVPMTLLLRKPKGGFQGVP